MVGDCEIMFGVMFLCLEKLCVLWIVDGCEIISVEFKVISEEMFMFFLSLFCSCVEVLIVEMEGE